MNFEQITKNNDEFRKTFVGGCIILSPMVLALSVKERKKLLKLIKSCNNFKNEFHNAGEVKFKNAKYLFAISFDMIDKMRVLRIIHQSEMQSLAKIIS